jgi:rRNA maturation protein Nop10
MTTIKSKIEELEKQIKELRKECDHPNFSVKRRTYIEYWFERINNIYTYDFKCKECGKKWSKTFPIDEYKKYIAKLKKKNNDKPKENDSSNSYMESVWARQEQYMHDKVAEKYGYEDSWHSHIDD